LKKDVAKKKKKKKEKRKEGRMNEVKEEKK
jgi:hypothetical protein